MKKLNDPQQKNDLSFKSFDDNPTNTGFNDRDWDEIRPPGKVRSMYDDEEDEDSMRDLWDDYSNE